MDKTDKARVSQDRWRMQNPYAHLDGDGELSAIVDYEIEPVELRERGYQNKYTDNDIKLIVRKLHTRLWRDKDRIWGDRSECLKLNEMLDPKLAIELMGFQVGVHNSLGQLAAHSKGYKVAALINKNEKLVHISNEFDRTVQSFMLAHELGHLVLHADRRMHRDVAVDGKIKRVGAEREADTFAALFLMPEKLLRTKFAAYFDSDVENTINMEKFLGSSSQSSKRRNLARWLAGATQYKGNHFRQSLAELFNVSDEAMAIRLEELDLI